MGGVLVRGVCWHACAATVAVLCLLHVGVQVSAAEPARGLDFAAPGDVGMSAAGLAEIGSLMTAMVADGELAGAVTLVARHGKIVHFESTGKQDRAQDTPMAKDTIFRIYSMTKPIAGTALMTFYDAGAFTLDDPVAKFIPQFKDLKVAVGEGPDGQPQVADADHDMTIRELVSHTGGLTYGFFSRSQVDTLYQQADVLNRDSTLHEMVEKLGAIPLRQQPGSAWHYSVSVDVQGYLVEVLAGEPFDKVLKDRIFDPLGMADTAFWAPPEKAARLAALYRQTPDGELVPEPSEYLTKPTLLSGGGGLVSTAMDYARFCQMLLNGGELDGVRILKPETVALMHTNQLPDGIEFINPRVATPGNTFGIDFAIVEQPDGSTDHAVAKGEYWWYGIAGTWFGINPVQDVFIVGMIQNFGGLGSGKARVASKKLVYEAIVD